MLSQFVRRGRSAFQSCDWLQVFFPALPSLINPSPGSLSLLQSRGLYLGASWLPSHSASWSLLKGLGPASGQPLFGACRTLPEPLWEQRGSTPTIPREEEESCQAEKREREFGSVTDPDRDRGPCPNWMDVCSYQWQIFNYKPTAINLQLMDFWGWGCWEHQNVWTLWCMRLWLMLFWQDVRT